MKKFLILSMLLFIFCGEDASEELDAELARQLLAALRARISYSFGDTQEFVPDDLEHSLR